MSRALVLLSLSACAVHATSATNAGPEAPNEKVLRYDGPLRVARLPMRAVEIAQRDVVVWGWVEHAQAIGDAQGGFAAAEALARADLAQLVEVAMQQLDLELQAKGESSASAREAEAIATRVRDELYASLGQSERAHQLVAREGEVFDRYFVRFRFPKSTLEDALRMSLQARPAPGDLARRIVAAFEPS